MQIARQCITITKVNDKTLFARNINRQKDSYTKYRYIERQCIIITKVNDKFLFARNIDRQLYKIQIVRQCIFITKVNDKFLFARNIDRQKDSYTKYRYREKVYY